MTEKMVNIHSRRRFIQLAGLGAGAVAMNTGRFVQVAHAGGGSGAGAAGRVLVGGTKTDAGVCADPVKIPGPIDRTGAVTHDIELVTKEVESEILPGITHRFMTFNGQIPGPMIRVRVGDTVNLTLKNDSDSEDAHSIDLHAVYGSGGGAHFTEVSAGQSKTFTFKATFPGALLYHCGVDNADEHISRGMFGMIVVEPEEGLPIVDREFYLGQHELYTQGGFGQPGETAFDDRAMAAESPTYVLFNGTVAPFTNMRFGPLQARVGETARIFVASGGPNLTSALHPIGSVWSRCWPQGGLANPPAKYMQTVPASPGSCFVGDLEFPVPQSIRLLDHALSRAIHKGIAADIVVEGKENPKILDAG